MGSLYVVTGSFRRTETGGLCVEFLMRACYLCSCEKGHQGKCHCVTEDILSSPIMRSEHSVGFPPYNIPVTDSGG